MFETGKTEDCKKTNLGLGCIGGICQTGTCPADYYEHDRGCKGDAAGCKCCKFFFY